MSEKDTGMLSEVEILQNEIKNLKDSLAWANKRADAESKAKDKMYDAVKLLAEIIWNA